MKLLLSLSRYFSYQRYASVTEGHAIRGQCYFILIESSKGVKNPCGICYMYNKDVHNINQITGKFEFTFSS